ncbi:hypothetical protein ACFQL0_02665 [Haloplanus litoreus]
MPTAMIRRPAFLIPVAMAVVSESSPGSPATPFSPPDVPPVNSNVP